ncbi:hypothetical protein INR49_010868 [Caranx melampygus]|nr:hypothetical protein INR49_010868 [Caranx melampygus]
MVSACGLPGTTSLGEASGLRPRPGLGLPADGTRGNNAANDENFHSKDVNVQYLKWSNTFHLLPWTA